MAKRRGLGKGLDALLTAGVPDQQSGGASPTEVELSQLHPNQYQPRTTFEFDALSQLAESIKAQGIIQPILVTHRAEGGFSIVTGERRWRAARLAGLDKVPVFVRPVSSEQEMLEAALVENLQRADLNALEEAEAYDNLQTEFGLGHEEIAGRVGKSRSTVSNAIRLLSLPEEVREMLREGALTAGQARPLLSLSKPEERIRLAERAVKEGLNARQIEALVKRGKGSKSKKATSTDPDTAAAQEKLTKYLQTKVEIKRRAKGGAVVISFHSEEELMRLYDVLTS